MESNVEKKKIDRKWQGREKKQLSFTSEFKEELEYLDSLKNASNFVGQLIRAHLNKEDSDCNRNDNEIIQRLDRIENILKAGDLEVKTAKTTCDFGDKILKSISGFRDGDDE